MATVIVDCIPDVLRKVETGGLACIELAMRQPIDLERTLARAQALRKITLAYPISDDAFMEAKTAGRA